MVSRFLVKLKQLMNVLNRFGVLLNHFYFSIEPFLQFIAPPPFVATTFASTFPLFEPLSDFIEPLFFSIEPFLQFIAPIPFVATTFGSTFPLFEPRRDFIEPLFFSIEPFLQFIAPNPSLHPFSLQLFHFLNRVEILLNHFFSLLNHFYNLLHQTLRCIHFRFNFSTF